jgi:hypothetical protein
MAAAPDRAQIILAAHGSGGTREEHSAMAKYYVTKVRKETGTGTGGTTHKHIVGVITDSGALYKNQQVVDSIDAGNEWYTRVPGEPDAKITKLARCDRAAGCSHKPYLTTAPDHSKKNNLEALPEG